MIPHDFSWKWKSGQGNAKFTTRVTRLFQEKYGVKLPSKAISELGNLIQPLLMKDPFRFSINNRMYWRSGSFSDNGSCYWGDRSAARLQVNADPRFHTLTMFSPTVKRVNKNSGIGRVLIFAPDDTHAVLFNSYGGDTRNIAMNLGRVLGSPPLHMNVRWQPNGGTSGIFWVNGGSVCVLGDPGRVDRQPTFKLAQSRGSVNLSCAECGTTHRVYWADDHGHVPLCYDCFQDYRNKDYSNVEINWEGLL